MPALAGRPATCCVYLLACGARGDLYCGWTTDLDRRLAVHRAGRGSRYVAARLPAAPVCIVACATRTEARSLEGRIKRLGRGAKLELVAALGLDGLASLAPAA